MEADSQGNIHLVFQHAPDSTAPIGLDYTYWNGAEWSSPISILLDPNGTDATMPQMVIDQSDVMHVVWNSNGRLYYSKSPSASAGSAKSWSKPFPIGQTYNTFADIILGPNDELYVAYSDASSPGQVSLVMSTDSGATWSSEIVIAETEWETVPGDVQLAIDDTGRMHAMWTAYALAQGNRSQGIFYAHTLGNELDTWNTAVKVSGPRHGQGGLVTVGDNEVHLVWRSNIGLDGTFHQWSNDGGVSWFAPDQYTDGGGFSGLPSFAIDSANRVHYTIGPVYYSMWDAGRLGPYVDLATKEIREQTTVSDGEGAILTITGGNRLHVVFHTDFTHIWYTTKLLNVPEVVEPLHETGGPHAIDVIRRPEESSQEDGLAILRAPTSTPILAPIPTRIKTDFPREIDSRRDIYSPLLLSVVPTVLLLAAVLIVSEMRRRH